MINDETMILYFIRHGEAGHVAPSDFERTLTTRGEGTVHGVGSALAGIVGRVHGILASPLVRAQQTAGILREYFDTATIETCEHLTPSAEPAHLLAELRHYTNDSNILLVSHEPFVSTCISYLTYGSTDARINIKPASVGCVHVGAMLERGAGRLDWLVTAEQLARMNHQ
jgi:phosphohistidine phosphatase